MPSERIQRQIDRLLAEADEAIGSADWQTVHRASSEALILDPENTEAQELFSIAERGVAGATTSEASPAPAEPAPPETTDTAPPPAPAVEPASAAPEPTTPAAAPPPAPVTPAKSGGGKRGLLIGLGAIVVVAAIAAGVFFSGALDSLTEDDEPELFAEAVVIDPSFVATLDDLVDVPSIPGAVDDRAEVRGLLGAPHAFSVSYEVVGGADENDGDVVRYETWVYYDMQTAFEFADGKLLSHLPADDVSNLAILPMQYDPASFTRDLTWDDVSVMLAEPGAAAETTLSEEEFGVFVQVYAGEQLLVAFDDDGLLVYAETYPLVYAQ